MPKKPIFAPERLSESEPGSGKINMTLKLFHDAWMILVKDQLNKAGGIEAGFNNVVSSIKENCNTEETLLTGENLE
ncbi:MAG: hypothetical protein AAF673_02870 [Pseudomonadota bacterium]